MGSSVVVTIGVLESEEVPFPASVVIYSVVVLGTSVALEELSVILEVVVGTAVVKTDAVLPEISVVWPVRLE